VRKDVRSQLGRGELMSLDLDELLIRLTMTRYSFPVGDSVTRNSSSSEPSAVMVVDESLCYRSLVVEVAQNDGWQYIAWDLCSGLPWRSPEAPLSEC